MMDGTDRSGSQGGLVSVQADTSPKIAAVTATAATSRRSAVGEHLRAGDRHTSYPLEDPIFYDIFLSNPSELRLFFETAELMKCFIVTTTPNSELPSGPEIVHDENGSDPHERRGRCHLDARLLMLSVLTLLLLLLLLAEQRHRRGPVVGRISRRRSFEGLVFSHLLLPEVLDRVHVGQIACCGTRASYR
jgi:hypothetical protein